MAQSVEHYDILIVGAGISGISAAYHLRKHMPDRSFLMLEGRENIGGTWDLFRYPGIRSDSDMYTLGYSFKPWKEGAAIAEGGKILDYLNETIEENNLRDKIRHNSRVVKADWHSADRQWILEVQAGADKAIKKYSCSYLFMCSGYYNYEQGYLPEFKGYEDFEGPIIHPQHWDHTIDYTDKRVVIIGSGATAVTLVPAMAEKAKHVTMLQRSPTYIISRPAADGIANWMRKWLPNKLAYKITRAKNVLLTMFMFKLARSRPEGFKKRLLEMVEKELGPDFDIKKDFTPRYNPWDQRLCLVPDSDLFDSFKNKTASVVTDHIERFTKTGIKLKSGNELEADIIVPATGLQLQALGGMTLAVDGKEVDLSETTNYKGMGLSNVPNFAWTVGYTNASWTLKADLTSLYVCRLLKHMDDKGYEVCTPILRPEDEGEAPLLDFSSGYITRSIGDLPKQGMEPPWKNHQNYISDMLHLKFERIDDGVMQFQ